MAAERNERRQASATSSQDPFDARPEPRDATKRSTDKTHYHFLLEFCHTHPGSHEKKSPNWRQEVVYEWRPGGAPKKDLPEDFAAFLDGRMRFGVKMGLQNVRRLFAGLGLDRGLPPVILVGGTNGKGTVTTAIGDALSFAGYRPGVYLSPHVERFLERIQVSGGDPDDAALDAACRDVRAVTERLDMEGMHPTYFEVATALALVVFRNERASPLVLEVGLGGRLDAVNALRPAVSVITNVGSDHADHLGATLAERVHEKAGILRPGVPCFTGAQAEALGLLRREALALGAPLVPVLPEEPPVDLRTAALALTRAVVTARSVRKVLPRLDRLDPTSVHLPHLPGRQEEVRLPNGARVLLDVAHNREALAALADRVDASPVPPDRRVLVAGLLQDKDAGAIGLLARARFKALHVTKPASPRARSAQALAAELETLGTVVASHDEDPPSALRRALAETPHDGLLVVTGSFYLLSVLRPIVRGLARGA